MISVPFLVASIKSKIFIEKSEIELKLTLSNFQIHFQIKNEYVFFWLNLDLNNLAILRVQIPNAKKDSQAMISIFLRFWDQGVQNH